MRRGAHRASPHRPVRRLVGVGGTVISVLVVALAQTDLGRASVSAPGYAGLTASSFDATDLVYAGIVSVPTVGSGTVDVLRFTLSHGSFTDAAMSLPCEDNQLVSTDAGDASVTAATFDVVSLDGSVAGTPVVFTVTAPPTEPFPSRITIDNLRMSAATLAAGTLTAPSLHVQPVSC